MKKVLIIFMALVFVAPIGVGMFGGGPPPPQPAGLPNTEADATQRALMAAIQGHCDAKHTQPAQRDACVGEQLQAFNASVGLLQEHAGTPKGAAMEACVAEHAPAITPAADWTKLHACLKQQADL